MFLKTPQIDFFSFGYQFPEELLCFITVAIRILLLIKSTLDSSIPAKDVLGAKLRIVDHFVNMAQNLLFEMGVVFNE